MDDDLDADQHSLSLCNQTSPIWGNGVGAPASEQNLASTMIAASSSDETGRKGDGPPRNLLQKE